MQFIGRSGAEVLFTLEDKAVLIDEQKNLVLSVDSADVLVASFVPEGDQTTPESSVPFELAVSATTDLDIKVFSNNDRMYTIPASVAAEAKRGLEWRKEENRGGTSVGLNSARTLARGGQIGIRKIRHIAKYFPRHEVDKKGTGYKPGQKNYPSNGRIAWALWGGDAARSWATAIVNRENKKAQANSITASFEYVMSDYESPTGADLNSFIEAEVMLDEMAPQFHIRIRLDGSGIDRLYKVNPDGSVFVWDDAMWEDLGNVNNDFETYDKSLDEPYDLVQKIHLPVDSRTAIVLSGLFDADPFAQIPVTSLEPEESKIFVDDIDGVDWDFIDKVSYDDHAMDEYQEYYEIEDSLIAAGEGGITNQDGNYTPEERSEKARGQVRDASGQFAKAGGKVVIGGNSAYSGTIESINPETGNVKVKLENGNYVDVPANKTQAVDDFKPMPQIQSAVSTKELTRNILGEPRVPIDRPYATLPGKLPQLQANQLQTVVSDYPVLVDEVRSSGQNLTAPAPLQPSSKAPGAIPSRDELMANKTPNAYNDPRLAAFLLKKVVNKDGTVTYPNSIWYRPDTKGVKPSDVEAYNPKKTSAENYKPQPYLQQPAPGFGPNTTSTPSSSTPASKTSTPVSQSPKTTTSTPTPTPTPKTSQVPYTTQFIRQPGETLDDIGPDGQKGKQIQSFKDPDTNRIRSEYTDGKKSWWGEQGTLVPAGFQMYEDGAIGPKDPKNPPKGSYNPAKVGPNGQKGNAVETFTDMYTNHIRTKYSDGKTSWYGEKDSIIAPGFQMGEDGALSRIKKPAIKASALVAAAKIEITPDNSDVPAVYMAIVAQDDPQAVMDLVALVPESDEGSAPMTFKRKPGKWEKDEQILRDLNSPTPPPVVVLDDDNLTIVLQQIDDVKPISASVFTEDELKIVAIMAAGGVDRNKGNAEELRRYWLYGKGAAKIRWRTAGDWTRCVRQLSKYMGPRAKGYCALRHKEATGMWTGDKEHRQLYGKKRGKTNSFSNEEIIPTAAVLSSSIMFAQMADAKARVMTAGGIAEPQEGGKFFIPLVLPEDIESGDGRKFVPGALTMRELPLPFLWQIKTGEGHNGSVVIGKITRMERVDNGIGKAYGYFDTGEFGKEAERLVRGGFIRGVSADLDMFEAKEQEIASKDSDKNLGGNKLKITKARVMAVTLVPKPAFQECTIELVDSVGENQEEIKVIQDGVYVDGVNPLDASALVACGIVAGAIPVTPPKEWFDNQKLKKPTALTVTDEGQVFGHIAAWHVDHIGMAFGTRPPRSKSGYAYFHTGVVRTEAGSDVPVGQLTLAGGHASLEASASEAVRHYDDSASAIADVHAGEDAYGIWVSGALRPGTTPEQIRSLRASAPSGDWRPIKGTLELVAVCQVNVPGFPIARARVASGQVMALVAAGASVLAQLKHDPLAEVKSRLENLEAPLVAAASDVKARMEAITAAIKAEALSNKVAAARNEDSYYMLQTIQDEATELNVITRKNRMKLAEEGKALKDGSFPIRDVSDLKNAIQAYGRSKPGKRGLVRRHIMKRARQLDRSDIIPESFKTTEIIEPQVASGFLENLEEVSSSFAAPEITEKDLEGLSDEELDLLKKEVKGKKKADAERAKYTPKTQPRDAKGKFRLVLARLKLDLGDVGADAALTKIEEAENLDNSGNYAGAAKAAGDLLGIIDRLDAKALNPESLENVRTSAGELGKVIANLPFAFGEDAQKIRFSDVPPVLRDLIEDMITRVEAKIGQKDADIATEGLQKFMSGSDFYSQSEISSQMAKLLRLLT